MSSRRASLFILLLSLGISVFPALVAAQNLGAAGVVKGTVKDASGAVVQGAEVTIFNPITGFQRTVVTGASGSFTFNNVPFNPYHLTVTAKGFAPHVQDVDLNSGVPLSLNIAMEVASGKTTVTVSTEASDLIAVSPTDRTDVDRALFDKLPLESHLRRSVRWSHCPRRESRPIRTACFTDWATTPRTLSPSTASRLPISRARCSRIRVPVDAVQSLEVIEGAPPAEYGGKTSLVIVATTRSGLGQTTPHGDVDGFLRQFGTSNGGFDLAYGGKKWGNFISANGLNTGRFLDGPEFRSCTITAMRRTSSTASISSLPKRTRSTSISSSPAPGSRRRIPTTPRMRRLVRTGG